MEAVGEGVGIDAGAELTEGGCAATGVDPVGSLSGDPGVGDAAARTGGGGAFFTL